MFVEAKKISDTGFISLISTSGRPVMSSSIPAIIFLVIILSSSRNSGHDPLPEQGDSMHVIGERPAPAEVGVLHPTDRTSSATRSITLTSGF
jgi:hypothetical protein